MKALLALVTCSLFSTVTWSTQITGELRVCTIDDPSPGCRCERNSDCQDFTRGTEGFCNPSSKFCIYCLHGEHIGGNITNYIISSEKHCVRSDSCNQTYSYYGRKIEVECIDSKCWRDGQKTDETCSCLRGFIQRRSWDDTYRCQDINECEGHIRCGNRHCINVPGSAYCGCRKGYRLANTGAYDSGCEEIDECEEVIGLCPQKCLNIPGSYNCTCQTGYQQIMQNGQATCVDIDECQLDVCMPLTTCYNTVGSFYCSPPIPAPSFLVTWSGYLIPTIVVAIIGYLYYRIRRLRKQVLKLSHEDLLDKGRYNVSAKTESVEVKPMLPNPEKSSEQSV